MKTISVSTFFFGCLFCLGGSLLAKGPVNQKGPIKLALNWKAEPQFGGFFAAVEKGFFKAEGLDVEILEGGSGAPTIQMLAAGKVDYAIVSGDEIILSHDRGASDILALFATFQTNPAAIMTHTGRGFKTLQDVFANDGVLLWQSGLPYAQFLQKKYGPGKVKTAPYLGGIGNFANDQKISQQCFITSEPLLAEKQKIKVKSFLIADSGFNPYTTVLSVKAARLKSDEEEVKKMVKAVRLGWQEYLRDPKATNLYMGKLNKAMDSITFESSAKAQIALIQIDAGKGTLGNMTSARWQALAQQLLDLKVIKQRPSPESLFHNY